MRVWRMSLRRTKNTIISWDGSFSLLSFCSILKGSCEVTFTVPGTYYFWSGYLDPWETMYYTCTVDVADRGPWVGDVVVTVSGKEVSYSPDLLGRRNKSSQDYVIFLLLFCYPIYFRWHYIWKSFYAKTLNYICVVGMTFSYAPMLTNGHFGDCILVYKNNITGFAFKWNIYNVVTDV